MRLLLSAAAITPACALRGKESITKAVNAGRINDHVKGPLSAAGSVTNNQAAKGTECTFVNSFSQFAQAADAGILDCPASFSCVEDGTSSLGGRCVEIFDEASYTEAYYAHQSSTHRRLATCTFANGTTGEKCTGLMACLGQYYADVSCGSCNGKKSCRNVYKAKIAEGSCNGENACYKLYGGNAPGVDRDGFTVVGEGSCVGYASCSYFMGEFMCCY
jgi:hypothetical protein